MENSGFNIANGAQERDAGPVFERSQFEGGVIRAGSSIPDHLELSLDLGEPTGDLTSLIFESRCESEEHGTPHAAQHFARNEESSLIRGEREVKGPQSNECYDQRES